MNNWIKAEYKRLRKLDWSAHEAIRAARIKDEFEDLEKAGFVKFEVSQDEFMSLDDLFGDMNPSKKERKEIVDRVNRDGLNEIQTFYRLSLNDKWISADGTCGFVGFDFLDSGYDTDAKASAIKAYKEEQEKLWTQEAEILAMLLIGRASSFLIESGINPADVLANMAAGADFAAVKEIVSKLENKNSALISIQKETN